MRQSKKLIVKILVAAGLCGLFAGIFFLSRIKKEDVSEPVVPPVRVTKARYGNIQQNLVLTGFVESETVVTVLPKVQGTLTELYVELADTVKKGETIARIDAEPYRLQLAQAQAAYSAADATWKRVSALFESGSVTQQTYDQTRAQYNAAKSQYELARLQFGYTDVTAPSDGVVLQVHTSAGNIVAPSVPIVTVGDMENTKIVLSVPERYYENFAGGDGTGKSVLIQVPALGSRTYGGTVKAVSPYISPQTRTFEIVCTASDSGLPSPLRPGMFVRVTLTLLEQQDAYNLPYTVLTGGRELWIVENGTAKKLPYEPLFEGDEYFRIPDEYKDYTFIAEGQHFLKDGAAVRVTDSAE